MDTEASQPCGTHRLSLHNIPRVMNRKRSREVYFGVRGRRAAYERMGGGKNVRKTASRVKTRNCKTLAQEYNEFKVTRPTCWGAMEKTPKTAPKVAVFCHRFNKYLPSYG